MSIETSKKLESYTGIKIRESGLEKVFAELKYNKKKPIYSYQSGIYVGMLIDKMSIMQPILESGEKIDKDLAMKMLEQIMPLVKTLVETYNWKLENLKDVAEQVFGDEK